MKYISTVIAWLFIVAVNLTAQEHKTVTVKAGTRVVDYFPLKEQYRYPEFLPGKVVFKDGTFTAVKMNYNVLYGDMQFIQSGDTLAIANVKEISYIQVMSDTFYFDHGYLEVLAGHDPSIMAVKHFVKLLDIQKEGAYGTRSSTSSVQTYAGIYDNGSISNNKLVRSEDMILSVETDYFIGNNKNGFVPYKRSNVLKVFPLYKSEIVAYLKRNPVNFNSKEDLVRLTEFLQEIK